MAENSSGKQGAGSLPPLLGVEEGSLRQAVLELKQARVIAYPTETQYGLGVDALNEEALQRLADLKDRSEGPFLVVAADSKQVEGMVAEMPPPAAILAERCWPGPVTILLPARPRLPGRLQGSEGLVAVRVSGYPAARRLPALLGAPVVSTSANRSGSQPLNDPRAIAETFGSGLACILNAGRLAPGPPSTLVEGGRTPLVVRREGAVSRNSLARRTGLPVVEGRPIPLLLLVCTGNTCRSPMAEGLVHHLLRKRGWVDRIDVVSAGVAAVDWGHATREAQRIAWERGVDISAHQPRQLTPDLAAEADLIVVMGEYHRNRVLVINPGSRDRTLLLRGLRRQLSGQRPVASPEVEDPIGRSDRIYRKVFRLMERELEVNLEALIDRAALRRNERNRQLAEAGASA